MPVYRFPPFEFDSDTGRLLKHGLRVKLQRKPQLVLACLLDEPGNTVSRQELYARLWPDGTVVEFDLGLSVAVKKLREALRDSSDQPNYIATVAGSGYRFIARVDSVASSNPTIAPTPAAIGGETSAPLSRGFPARSPRPTWSQTRHYAFAALVVAMALGTLVAHLLGTRPAVSARTESRKSIAVIGFRNLSGDPADAWLATALTDWLTTDLSAGGRLRAIPEETVARMRVELGLIEPDRVGPGALTKIRDNLATDLVVSGSYARSGSGSGSSLRLDLRLQDARSAEILNAVSVTGRLSEIFDLVSQGGSQLRRSLSLESLSPAEVEAVRETLPGNPEAARLYAQGKAKLQRFDDVEARALLERAVAIEPRHALSHAALASAWSNLGHSTDARAEAKSAFELSPNLPMQEKLLVEGQFREASYDWDKAIGVYRSLFVLYPDNVEYGLRLARAETAAGRPLMALDTVRRLHQLSAPSSEDPRIDLAVAEAAASVSDFRRQQEAAANAIVKGRRNGSDLLIARAEITEGEALRALGNFADALRIWSEAKQKFASAGDRGALARTLIDEGRVRWQQGDPKGSKESYEQAIAISKEIGDEGNLGRALSGLGVIEMFQVGPVEGRRLCDAALAVFRRIGNKQEEAYTLSLIADIVEARHKEAEALYSQSLQLSREVNDRSRIAGRLMDLGIIATVRGDLPTARLDLEQSLEIYREIGERNREALQLNELAIVLKWEGKLDQAEQYTTDAIAILTSVGETNVRGQVRETLALAEMEHGKLAEAERTMRLALEDHRQARDAGSVGIATAYMAEILAAEGRFAESRTALNQYDGIVRLNPPLGEHLSALRFTRARLYASAGQFGAALREARSACSETLQMDQGTVHMKARLVLAETELQSGDHEAGHLHLEQLLSDAEARDFGLIAQKAREALQAPTGQMKVLWQ
jgi:DNA-binding winged helix-turn-helix (wHTH) protein/tetratricopeptide (TPR) repeat protein